MKDSSDKTETSMVMECYTILMANFVIREAGKRTLSMALEYYIMKLRPK